MLKMMSIRKILETFAPTPVVRAVERCRLRKYKNLSREQIFTRIYAESGWAKSGDPSQEFYSGCGSHDERIVRPYVHAVSSFLSSFPQKPSVVDLGCGDFFVGSQLRPLCGVYIACDIVRSLISFNREKFRSLDVEFRALDLVRDELPQADILFLRQVLQHLSNDDIQRALPQIASKYKYAILTEHLPLAKNFLHNLDKPTGPNTRLSRESGVVLTSSPFDMKVNEQRDLCHVRVGGGTVRTTLYSF